MQLAVCGICRVVCFLFLSGLVSFAYFCWCYLNFQIFCITLYVPLPISSELNESENTFLFVAVSCFQSLIICPKFTSLKLVHKSPCLDWESNNCKDANIPRCSQGLMVLPICSGWNLFVRRQSSALLTMCALCGSATCKGKLVIQRGFKM